MLKTKTTSHVIDEKSYVGKSSEMDTVILEKGGRKDLSGINWSMWELAKEFEVYITPV